MPMLIGVFFPAVRAFFMLRGCQRIFCDLLNASQVQPGRTSFCLRLAGPGCQPLVLSFCCRCRLCETVMLLFRKTA